jgi:putative glutamine amidotransferase
MTIFTATSGFYYDFKAHYPGCKIVKEDSDIYSADMIIFTGGEDINPQYYGEKMEYMNYFNPKRDTQEEHIFWTAINAGVPKILGVCRGHQLICALLGGKLFQDIRAQTKHFHEGRHNLDLIDGGGLVGAFFPWVNSMHHQGVYMLPSNTKLIPTSAYGGVFESCEGIVGKTKIFTTQFHPEFMTGTHKFFEHVLEVQ